MLDNRSLQSLAAHRNTLLEAALVRLARQKAALVVQELQELVTAAVAEAHPPQVTVAQVALVLRLEEAAEAAARAELDQQVV